MRKLLLIILLLFTFFMHAQCYESLYFGGSHTVGIKADGTLWGWGRGDYGQLGTVNWTEPNSIQIGTINNIDKFYIGPLNTFVIKNDGTLWGVGSNLYGSLGVNSNTDNFIAFQQITMANNWLKVSTSPYFTLALKTNGTIWAWGQDNNNQTGNPPSSEAQLVPIQIGTVTDWIDVAANTNSTAFALKSDGTLWGWGSNAGSLLVASASVYSLSTPTQITTVATWVKMSVGGGHILAQKADGTLWSWGDGAARGVGEEVYPGNIPLQIGTDTWKSFSTGGITSFGVKIDGTLWSWGYNTNGELGDGTTITRYVPLQIGTDTNWENVQARSYSTTMATKTDGTIYYWGSNYYGEFGNGMDYSTDYYTSPQLTPNICVNTLAAPTFEQTDIKVYPNPVENLLFVESPETQHYKVYSILGAKISEGTLLAGSTIDCSDLASGVYLLNLTNAFGGVKVVKFVKE